MTRKSHPPIGNAVAMGQDPAMIHISTAARRLKSLAMKLGATALTAGIVCSLEWYDLMSVPAGGVA